jgi:hypothetical protein
MDIKIEYNKANAFVLLSTSLYSSLANEMGRKHINKTLNEFLPSQLGERPLYFGVFLFI